VSRHAWTAPFCCSAPWWPSIPEFALGVFLASIFVVWLGWLPGTATLVAGGGWSVATQLVLPVAVIVLFRLRLRDQHDPAPR